MYYLIALAILLVVHFVLIETYRRWFLKLTHFEPILQQLPPVDFTVVIPARNEAQQIRQCLLSVLGQRYPKHNFEVIVVDDYSTDDTPKIVAELKQRFPNLVLLQLEKLLQAQKTNSYKKKAIAMAIDHAKGKWIVTTDADCKVSPNWLANFNAYIQRNNSVFIAAPVKFINTGSFVSVFQCLDFMSLQGITAAAVHAGFHSMCNGANLAYRKDVFYEVGGFNNIDNIASGDDMLLMHKIYRQYKQQVHYLFSKTSIVETLPMPTWRAFFNQRVRWASKADKFDDKRILLVLSFVYLLNLVILLLPFAAFWSLNVLRWWLAIIIAKTLIELRFMLPVARFFGQQKLLWWFAPAQPFHVFYTVVAGWLGKFGKYRWKGRVVK